MVCFTIFVCVPYIILAHYSFVWFYLYFIMWYFCFSVLLYYDYFLFHFFFFFLSSINSFLYNNSFFYDRKYSNRYLSLKKKTDVDKVEIGKSRYEITLVFDVYVSYTEFLGIDRASLTFQYYYIWQRWNLTVTISHRLNLKLYGFVSDLHFNTISR